ncbi:hypothetical protein ACVIIV_003396 [Bradyrhizobium sp. USDA 4354]
MAFPSITAISRSRSKGGAVSSRSQVRSPVDLGRCSSLLADKFRQPSELRARWLGRRSSRLSPILPRRRGLDCASRGRGFIGRGAVEPIVPGHDRLANRNTRIGAAKQLPGFGRADLDQLKTSAVGINRCSAEVELDCRSRNLARGGTNVPVVCHVEHPSLVGNLLVPRRQRGALGFDDVSRALVSGAASPRTARRRNSLGTIRMGLAALGADHRAHPRVDEVDAFARCAGYCVQSSARGSDTSGGSP